MLEINLFEYSVFSILFFFFQAEDGIRDIGVTGVQTCALPIYDRLIEAGNAFEGLRVGVGDGALRSPQHWWKLRNPMRPSWGEPYVEIAARMLAAVEAARDAARGAAVVCVSHRSEERRVGKASRSRWCPSHLKK